MAYNRINWQNEPSEATAVNNVNLNKMDSAIYDHDQRLDDVETDIDNKVDKVTGKGLSQVDNVTVTQHVAYGTVVSTIKTYKQDGTEVTSQVCNGVIIDSALSDSSTNPVQNKVVKSALDNKVDKVSGQGLSKTNDVQVTSSTNVGTEIATVQIFPSTGGVSGVQIKNGVVVDSALSSSSENPVQNKVVKSAIDAKSTVAISDTLADGTVLANITIDGTTTAIKGSDIEVDEELSPASTNPVENRAIYDALNNLLPSKTVSGNPISISDASGFNAKALKVTLNPIQDLHGYEYPWAGGAGKNKLPLTVSGIKALNTGGTWSGNVYMRNNVTFELLVNSANAVVGIKVNGTASANTGFTISRDASIVQPSTSYNINGAPLGTSSSTCRLQVNINEQTFAINVNGDDNSATTPSLIDKIDCYITVLSGQTANNFVFQPMIRLATVTDATFAPYSNICPISGRTEASVNQGSVDITTLYNGQIQSNGGFSWNNNRISNVNSSQMNTYFLKKGTHTLTFNKLNQSAPDLVECTVMTKNDNFQIVDNFAMAWHSLPYTFELTADAYVYFTARKDYNTALNTADYKTLIIDETHTHQYGQTVYGGEDDFVNGGLTNEWVLAEYDGTENWLKASSATWDVFFVELADEATGLVADIRSDSTNISVYSFSQMVENAPCVSIRTNITPNRLHIAIPNVSTISECKAYLAEHNLQVCYKKATPTTIQTSAENISLLKGNNVLSTNADDMELKYSVSLDSLLTT